MEIKPSKKMAIFGPSIFGKLKQAADEKMKTGADIINLSIGSPDLPPHEIIRKVLAEKSMRADVYGYTLGGAVVKLFMMPTKCNCIKGLGGWQNSLKYHHFE